MTTGEDTHGCDNFTSLFLLPLLCNSTVPEELVAAAEELIAEREERAEADRRAHYAGADNIWPEEQVTSQEAEPSVGESPEL